MSTGMAPAVTAEPAAARRLARTGWIWIALVLLVVGGAGAAISAAGDPVDRGLLDPDSAGPDGTRALVEILRAQGVDVRVARDRGAAAALLADGPATLVMPDSAYLSDDAVQELADASADAVVLSATARIARLLFPGTTIDGIGPDRPLAESCDLPEATRAGPIVGGVMLRPGGTETVACYREGDRAALLVADDGGTRVSLLDARELFTNEHLAENGNAALALNLMGRHADLVWYVPTPADSDLADAAPTLGELTPTWVTPVMVLLLCAAIAAGVWRGRRFGPLVIENLPVTVRASETMEGRARLAERSGDGVGALDQLRLDALDRLAVLLGLGPAASADEIAEACADRSGAQRGVVRDILIEHVPADDADLVTSADRLRDLETAVRSAVRPEGNPS